MDKLQAYRDKRDAARTPEPVPPPGAPPPDQAPGGTFVIQEHHARRLHWDFRLERDGVLVSWALPKGVPNDPAVNHLAVHTEDHPLEYGRFEGEIPRGEYGAGAVTIWDHGRYETLKWAPSEVKVVLHGQRVTGGYVLFQTKGSQWMIHRERLALPAAMRPMLAVTGAAAPRPGQLGAGDEVGRRPGPGLHRAGPGAADVPDRARHHGVLPGAGPAGRGHCPQAAAARRGDRGVRGGRLAGVRGPSAADARQLGLAGRPAGRADAGDVPGVRPAPAGRQAAAGLEYTQRRALLDELALAGPYWQTPPWFPGADFDAVQVGLRSRTAWKAWWPSGSTRGTRPGVRTDSWRKIKNVRTQEAVVAGYKPGKGNRTGQVGSLLIGVNDASGLIYAGHVGTGFTDETLRIWGISSGRCAAPTRRSTARSRPSTPAPRSGSSPGW